MDVAAQLKADLDACAQLLAEAAAELQASARAEVEAANDCGGCEETVIVEKSEKFCKDVDVIVETLGEGESFRFRSLPFCLTPPPFFSSAGGLGALGVRGIGWLEG